MTSGLGAEPHLVSGGRLGCEPGGRFCGAEEGLRLVWAGGACSPSGTCEGSRAGVGRPGLSIERWLQGSGTRRGRRIECSSIVLPGIRVGDGLLGGGLYLVFRNLPYLRTGKWYLGSGNGESAWRLELPGL